MGFPRSSFGIMIKASQVLITYTVVPFNNCPGTLASYPFYLFSLPLILSVLFSATSVTHPAAKYGVDLKVFGFLAPTRNLVAHWILHATQDLASRKEL
jgi:hypothetical protein